MDTSERLRPVIIACIEDHPKAMLLLHYARRKAQERNCDWGIAFIETPTLLIAEDARERLLRLLTLSEHMGGLTFHIEAESLEKGLATFLEKEKPRLELLIIGNSEQGRKLRLQTPSYIKMLRAARKYTEVEVLPLAGHAYHPTLLDRFRPRSLKPSDLLFSLAAVAVAFGGATLLQWMLPPALFRINDQNVALLFMIACAFVAGRYGLLPGLIASAASFVTVNYFFTLPYHALKIATVTDIINMALFLSAAILISLFTSQARAYAHKSAQRERSTQALFALYRVASEAYSPEQALDKLQRRLERMLEVKVAFFLPDAEHQSGIAPSYPKGLELPEKEWAALTHCWGEMKTTGQGSPFHPEAEWRFEPMISQTGEVGVLGICPKAKGKLDPWFGHLLTAIADQTATILQHIGLERSMEASRLSEEREKLRAMLLSSVSHDFKTPLAGILGALSVYRSLGSKLTAQKQNELIETAITEAQRLDHFITNILDMTRIESGNIQFHKEWHNVENILADLSRRLQPRCKNHKLVIHPYSAEIEVYMDLLMTEQVIQNIIDNACKYTPAGTRIELSTRLEPGAGFICEIRDFGAGIPADQLDLIFDKYTRLHKRDMQVAGTGLGLAIARAVMEEQGGWITARNHPEGGAIFTLCLTEYRPLTSQLFSEKTNAA